MTIQELIDKLQQYEHKHHEVCLMITDSYLNHHHATIRTFDEDNANEFGTFWIMGDEINDN